MIETGIPIPPLGPKEKYPFNDLEVMQSFYWPATDIQDRRRLVFLLCRLGKSRKGKKFTLRSVKNEDGSLGVRVWRIE